MKIYVDKIPKDCSECGLCMEGQVKLQKKGRYVDAKGCVLGDFYKYRTMDDEIDTCPLEIYKGNQTAIECLSDLGSRIYPIYIAQSMHKQDGGRLTRYGEGDFDVRKQIIEYINNKIKELEEGK